jgi:hypothetical protein
MYDNLRYRISCLEASNGALCFCSTKTGWRVKTFRLDLLPYLMGNGLNDIQQPPTLDAPVSVDQVVSGMRLPPQQQIQVYTSEEWEAFVEEWAFYCLKDKYVDVQRWSGPGDKGRDVVGFCTRDLLPGPWDNYQCKQYDHALREGDIWPEIGKILWHTFNNEFGAPRAYFFVAPRGVGSSAAALLADAGKLKAKLITVWHKNIRTKITDTAEVKLEGPFLGYVDAFDFSIFHVKQPLRIIEEHKKCCPFHAMRFGGGLPPRPKPDAPPAEVGANEIRYVQQLLDAYGDHLAKKVPDVKALAASPKLRAHFERQRESFYSLRVFARDNVPSGTFESFQQDIYAGVVDIHDQTHSDAYVRVIEVTRAAREVQITANALVTCAKPKDRDGICHQLANEDILTWLQS